jgi:small subunit ribosomal protein S17e
MIIGRIKTGDIKKASLELMERYPDRFSREFEENKKILKELNLIEEKRARNKVAGYITHTIKRKAA